MPSNTHGQHHRVDDMRPALWRGWTAPAEEIAPLLTKDVERAQSRLVSHVHLILVWIAPGLLFTRAAPEDDTASCRPRHAQHLYKRWALHPAPCCTAHHAASRMLQLALRTFMHGPPDINSYCWRCRGDSLVPVQLGRAWWCPAASCWSKGEAVGLGGIWLGASYIGDREGM